MRTKGNPWITLKQSGNNSLATAPVKVTGKRKERGGGPSAGFGNGGGQIERHNLARADNPTPTTRA